MKGLLNITDLTLQEVDGLIKTAEDIERLKKFRANPSDESWIAG